MKKLLNISLLVTFFLTILVPLTGIHLHKLFSVLFLLLCAVHTLSYRRRLGWKRIFLLALVALCFATGLVGMLRPQWPWILIVHRALSILAVFFLAIHIFVFHKRLLRQPTR